MKLPYQRHQVGRYFENAFLERASKVHPATPFLFYLPLLFGFSFWALHEEVTTWKTASLWFPLGIFVWQWMEYGLHRFAFHFEGLGPKTRRLHEIIHGLHHRYPDDPLRWVMPLGASFPLALMVGGLLFFWKAPLYTVPLFVGILTGYLFYDYLHWSVHGRKPRTTWGKKLRAHHLAHHFADSQKHFGISQTWMDALFQTLRVPKKGG